MLAMVKPRHFMPVHGAACHLRAHARIAQSMGVPEKNIFILDNGDTLEMRHGKVRRGRAVESGVVYVDGGNVTDANPVVLRDRQKLAQDGVVSVTVAISGKRKNVSAVEVTCRGISFGSDEELMEEARQLVRSQADKLANSDGASIDALRRNVRNSVSNLFWNKTHTRPMVIPVVLEV